MEVGVGFFVPPTAHFALSLTDGRKDQIIAHPQSIVQLNLRGGVKTQNLLCVWQTGSDTRTRDQLAVR